MGVGLCQETEVTSTSTRPVDNVVITKKDLQDTNNNCLMEERWKIKVNYLIQASNLLLHGMIFYFFRLLRGFTSSN